MIDPCPCHKCTERFTACSDRCPKDDRGEFGYKAWKKQHDGQKKYFEDNKFRFSVPMTDSRNKAYSDWLFNKSYGGDQ